ncbi:hypothetical protein [Zooshikella ganghwensis]|uniref:hypothetical protein n=1 Tax=Zooshikella ganghwensis TaxID=202772 RepID=UPI000481A92D|nr:hypothetical protein [Zooshikella ganghwensis]
MKIYRVIGLIVSYLLVLMNSGWSYGQTETDTHYEFWNRPVEISRNPDVLYFPPKVAVTLVDQNKQPVQISHRLYQLLSSNLEDYFPGVVVDDFVDNYWDIKVQPQVGENNSIFLPYFMQMTVACMKSLTVLDDAFELEKAIIDSDEYVANAGDVEQVIKALLGKYQPIANKMLQAYKKDRCDLSNNNYRMAPVVQERLMLVLEKVLKGKNDFRVSSADLFVFSKTFESFYFGSQGLWVRKSLNLLKETLTSTLGKFTSIASISAFEKEHDSFWQFLRETSLVDQEIKNITDYCVVNTDDLFQPFSFTDCKAQSPLMLIKLTLGNQSSLVVGVEQP